MKKRSKKAASSKKQQGKVKSLVALMLAVTGGIIALDGVVKAVEHLLAIFTMLH